MTNPALTTRRDWIARAAAIAGAIAVRPTDGWAQGPDEISRNGEIIRQVQLFKAPPQRVYAALTETARFNEVVKLSAAMNAGGDMLGKSPTTISREAGGTFSLFGGHITGRHIELVPDQRIVQAWRVGDWEPGAFSIARFDLSAQGAETKLTFLHTGFPTGMAPHLAEGWHINYWEPLAKYLAR
jgi:activator of HSP90 ATPase